MRGLPVIVFEGHSHSSANTFFIAVHIEYKSNRNTFGHPKISHRVFSPITSFFYSIDDHCQYWLNKADGILRSPNFGANDKLDYYYDCNLNCTWILDTDSEYYITLEIEYFRVNDNDTNDIYLHTIRPPRAPWGPLDSALMNEKNE